jgi:hypothetical protein
MIHSYVYDSRHLGILLVVLFFLFSCSKPAKDDPNVIRTNFIILSHQHSVDSLVDAFKGRSGINIDGVLSIGDGYPNDITDISGLKFLIRVNEFHIRNTKLTSLSGLENVTSVNNIFIYYNAQLLSLDGLKNLKSSDGSVEIVNNDALTSTSGLMSLEKVGLAINLNDKSFASPGLANEKLSVISLPSLRKVASDLDFRDINAATSINLPLLDSIGGSILIRGAGNIVDLAGISNLKYIGGDLSIGTSGITTLSGMNKINSVGGTVYIGGNPNLTNLTGLNLLKDIKDSIIITTNNKLNNISALGVTRTAKKVTITSNPLLSNLCPIKPLVQNMLLLYPGKSDTLLFNFKNNSASLPQPYTYTNLLNGCP